MRSQTSEVITPPIVGETVWAFDANEFNAASWIACPAAWANAVLEFHADGETFVFGFGAALTTIAPGTSSTVTSNAVAAQNACAYVLPNGARVKVDMARVPAAKKATLAILGVTGTTDNMLRVTLCDSYPQ